MANKLKGMKYSSVDLCKRGANPLAHIRLFKSRDGGKGGETDINIAKTADGEAFDMAYAFYESIASIIADPKLSDVKKADMMRESLGEFTDTIEKAIDDWSEDESIEKSYELTDARIEAMQDVIDRFSTIVKAATEDDDDDDDDDLGDDDDENKLPNRGKTKTKKCKKIKKEKGGIDIMSMIDIKKMTPEELVVLKGLTDKYGTADDVAELKKAMDEAGIADGTGTGAGTGEGTGAGAGTGAGNGEGAGEGATPELHPDVKKALEEVAQLKKSLEMNEITTIAKKYEAIGKKADELAPKLYDLKKAGGTAYDDFIAVLDEMMTTQENSGIFKEIGSGRGQGASDLEGIVTEIRKAAPEITYEQAVIKAYEQNPTLDPITGKLK